MKITTISVRVMRSFDYSHFEICTSATLDEGDNSQWCTDELRKQAARLADKAVEQYKIAKANFARLRSESSERTWEGERVKSLKEKPETDRTPEEQARIKEWDDTVWAASRRFDYEDEWDDDEPTD